jgi:hypothetical protein
MITTDTTNKLRVVSEVNFMPLEPPVGEFNLSRLAPGRELIHIAVAAPAANSLPSGAEP